MAAQAHPPSPACCLASAAVVSVTTACVGTWLAACAGLVTGMALLCWRRPPKIWKRLAEVNIFVGLLFVFVPFFAPGTTVWKWGFLEISGEGLALAFLTGLKANAIACQFMALVAPLGISQLASGMHQLHLPKKLIWMLLLMGRNITILHQQWRKLNEAALLRGFSRRTSLYTYRTLGVMFAILLLRSHDRSRIIYEAMLLRGFNGTLPFKTSASLNVKDWILLASTLGASILVAGLNWIAPWKSL